MFAIAAFLHFSGFVANTYQKPYSTTTMLLILFGVTILLIVFQYLLRNRNK